MPVKCYSIVIGHKNEAKYASIGDELIWEEKAVKLLGPIIDRELISDTYVRTICKKASQKLTAILRLANILSEHKRKVF